MSRLGKLPIKLPDGTQAKIENDFLIIKGPKGELREKINSKVRIDFKDKEIIVSVKNSKDKQDKSLWGLFRSLINNMVTGVNEGFEKKLEINGVGYRAAAAGRKLTLTVGFSHPVEKEMPEGIDVSVEGSIITVSGADKQLVGEVAAQIRKVRQPEPYKGKGIKYVDEIVRRKAGKSAVKGE